MTRMNALVKPVLKHRKPNCFWVMFKNCTTKTVILSQIVKKCVVDLIYKRTYFAIMHIVYMFFFLKQAYGGAPQYGGAPYGQQPYPQQGPITAQPTMYIAPGPLSNPVNDYLCYSIFTMICCCLPLGIAALIYSIQVSVIIGSGRHPWGGQWVGPP